MSWKNDLALMMNPGEQQRGLKIAVMTGPKTCRIGKLDLQAEDLKIAAHLLAPVCTKVKETAPSDGGLCTDQSTYIPALAAGDQVLVYQMSDDSFVILEKVVNA